VSSTTPSKFDRQRDRANNPLLYDIAKHAQAAANHRTALRDRIVTAHREGVDHAVIADTAGVTVGAVENLIEQVEAVTEQSDLVYARR
jgi:predicted metalloendopeptidase